MNESRSKGVKISLLKINRLTEIAQQVLKEVNECDEDYPIDETPIAREVDFMSEFGIDGECVIEDVMEILLERIKEEVMALK